MVTTSITHGYRHENKKTIVNSLRTLSSQIYSATARIVYELIQNADDCTFADDGRLRQLRLESGEDTLVAYCNEKGERLQHTATTNKTA